jgi:hypothetical protein
MREIGLSIIYYSLRTHPETGHRSRQMRRDRSIARLRRGGDCQSLLPACRYRSLHPAALPLRIFGDVLLCTGKIRDRGCQMPRKSWRDLDISTTLGPSKLRDVSLTRVVKLRDVSLTRVGVLTSLQSFQGIFRSLLYCKAKRYEVHLLTAKKKFTLCTTSIAILPESRACTRTIPRLEG